VGCKSFEPRAFKKANDNVGRGLLRTSDYSKEFDQKSRKYYGSLDTALVYTGHIKITGANLYIKWWELIDLASLPSKSRRLNM